MAKLREGDVLVRKGEELTIILSIPYKFHVLHEKDGICETKMQWRSNTYRLLRQGWKKKPKWKIFFGL